MKHQNEQKKLKTLVRELERELSQEKSQVQALEETHERLRQAEHICQELANENRGLREQLADWQKRVAASEENHIEINIFRQQFDALQAEYERVVAANRELEKKANFYTQQAETSSMIGAASSGAKTSSVAESEPGLNPTSEWTDSQLQARDRKATTKLPKENYSQIIWHVLVHRWRWGLIIAGLIIFVMTGALTFNSLKTEVPNSDSSISEAETLRIEPEVKPVSKLRTISAPNAQPVFKTIRPAQVFSEPTEDSALVAEIGKGVKVNVVGSKNGWLEIRSKHGRPPGFIREEQTIRIGSN